MTERDFRSGRTTDNDSRSGLVLAGGFSKRFGDRDKALADLGGEPMIRRVVERVSEATDEVVVNCRDEQVPRLREALSDREPPVEFAVDEVPDRGPLGGLHAGLEAIDTDYAAVVACDMPFVDPSLLELLFDRATGRDGAVVRHDDGWFQTTQAVYRVEPMARECRTALSGTDGRILTALEDLDYAVVPEDDLDGVAPDTFFGVDTRDALREAEERL